MPLVEDARIIDSTYDGWMDHMDGQQTSSHPGGRKCVVVSVSTGWQTHRERERKKTGSHNRTNPNTPHIDTSIINVVDGILYQEDEAEEVEVVVEEEDKEKKEKENRCNFEKSSSCCCRIK